MIKDVRKYERWESEHRRRKLSSMTLEESLRAANMLHDAGQKLMGARDIEGDSHILALARMSDCFRRIRDAGRRADVS